MLFGHFSEFLPKFKVFGELNFINYITLTFILFSDFQLKHSPFGRFIRILGCYITDPILLCKINFKRRLTYTVELTSRQKLAIGTLVEQDGDNNVNWFYLFCDMLRGASKQSLQLRNIFTMRSQKTYSFKMFDTPEVNNSCVIFKCVRLR